MTKISFEVKTDMNAQQVGLDVENKLKAYLLELMLNIEGYAKRYAPVDTGRLRASIHTKPKRPSSTIEVSDGVHYGIHQEYGTKSMKPQPFMRPALNLALNYDVERLAKKHKLI